jgi:DNA-binding beta-propeller fold protein YncE
MVKILTPVTIIGVILILTLMTVQTDTSKNSILFAFKAPSSNSSPDQLNSELSSKPVDIVESNQKIPEELGVENFTGEIQGNQSLNHLFEFGATGIGDGEFIKRERFAVDSQDNLYVVDAGNQRVQKFDSDGNFISKWGKDGLGNGEFKDPTDIALDSQDNVYVVDAETDSIQKFDSDGNFISRWGPMGKGDGEFHHLFVIAADSNDHIYIVDHKAEFGFKGLGIDSIKKYDSDGNFISKWGKDGLGNGEFDGAFDITTDSHNNVYVVDYGNNRVQKFDSDGNFISKWGSIGKGDGEFDAPIHIIADSQDNLYVVDSGNQRVQKFDSDGNFITKWYVTLPEKDFNWPSGIAMDSQDNIYLGEELYETIRKFSQ